MIRYEHALFWFRRDLRITDNVGLFHALQEARRVTCVFVFDLDILRKLSSPQNGPGPWRRVQFLWQCVAALAQGLREMGSDLRIEHARAVEAIPRLALQLGSHAVYANHDYEPAALVRDDEVRAALGAASVDFNTYKDQCVFEKSELLTQAAKPYTVFTPYKNAWLAKLADIHLQHHDCAPLVSRLAPATGEDSLPPLASLGFALTDVAGAPKLEPGERGALVLLDDFTTRITHYKVRRDFPAVRGVSYLSAHLRFGTISIRELVRRARLFADEGAATWLSELIWRDFYFQILWHHPQVVDHAFKREYDAVGWQNNEIHFAVWCEARTGYPIVDAAMRQLNQTGYMHNRLRMIVASFLTKDLLIDWRWGERYFSQTLTDYDLAANNGGWQWAASTGCDAQPYFRIFNPIAQSQKFDPEGRFIRRYLPELARCNAEQIHAPWTMTPQEQAAAGAIIGRDYPVPIVDHGKQREKALAMFTTTKKMAYESMR